MVALFIIKCRFVAHASIFSQAKPAKSLIRRVPHPLLLSCANRLMKRKPSLPKPPNISNKNNIPDGITFPNEAINKPLTNYVL